jgi:hypothetical protein
MTKTVAPKDLSQWMKDVVTLLQNLDHNIYKISKHIETVEQKQDKAMSLAQKYYERRRSRDCDDVGLNSRGNSPEHPIPTINYQTTPSQTQPEEEEVDIWWKVLDALGLEIASARYGNFDSIDKWRVDIRKDVPQDKVEKILGNMAIEYANRNKKLTGKIDVAVCRSCGNEQFERKLYRYTWNDELGKFEGTIGNWVKEDKEWVKMNRQMQIELRWQKNAQKTRSENNFKEKLWISNENVLDAYDICFSSACSAYVSRKVLKFVINESAQPDIIKWCDGMQKELVNAYLKIEVGVCYKEGSVNKYRTYYKFLDSNSWKVINDKTLLDADVLNLFIIKWLGRNDT